jgi:trigger factor
VPVEAPRAAGAASEGGQFPGITTASPGEAYAIIVLSLCEFNVSDVKVSIQEVSAVEKRLEVSVPAAQVDAAFKAAVQKISRQAKVPGFRPGKIPANVVEKMFGPQVADEVAQQIINETYFKAIDEHKIRTVDMPKVNNELAKRGAEFKYTATVEVIPPVELKSYKGLSAEVEKLGVTEHAIEQTIDQMRQSKAELKEVETKRPIQADDFAIIDLEATEGGKPVADMSAKGFTVPIGGGIIFEEVENALKGMQVGDTKDVTVAVPADAQNEKLAGRTLEFKVTVQGLKEKNLPALDDELAKDLGDYESLADLRAKVTADLERQLADRIRSTKREHAIDALIAANPLDVPAGLASRETDNLVHRAVHDYEQRGVDAKRIDTARLWSQLRPVAERNIRTELLLDAVATRENISIDDAAMNKFFEDEAARYGTTADVVKRAFMQSGTDIKDRMRIDQALQLVVNETKWKETEPAGK